MEYREWLLAVKSKVDRRSFSRVKACRAKGELDLFWRQEILALRVKGLLSYKLESNRQQARLQGIFSKLNLVCLLYTGMKDQQSQGQMK